MQATEAVMSRADAMSAIEDLFAVLKVKTKDYKPLTLSQNKANVAQFVEGLLHIIRSDVCHGDLKPANIFRSDRRFDIGDFGGSIIISNLIKQMNKKYALNGEAERSAMNKFLNVFCDPNADPARVEAACAKHKPQIQQLVTWGIVKQKKGKAIPDVALFKKGALNELRDYLKIKCYPDKTTGYGYNPYMNAMCDYYWRCDEDNYRRACNTFDIRAAGVTIFVIFTAEKTPSDDAKQEYYDKLETSLRAQKISKKAISIIRRMAEPMKNVDTSPEKVFPLPVSIQELEELRAEMLR